MGLACILAYDSVPEHYSCLHEHSSIPALDGGHVFFLLYEIITGRKPGDKFMERAEYIGFGILILLLVVANLNDVLRLFGIL